MAEKMDSERAAFEKWYVENAFDYEANPLGSRDCGLQWKAWQAAHLTQPAQAVDVGALVEAIASEWDGCEYEGVGEHIDIGAAIRRKARALGNAQAEGWKVPEVTFDMMRQAEHFCPIDLPHLDKLRWKARKLTDLLNSSPTPPQPEE